MIPQIVLLTETNMSQGNEYMKHEALDLLTNNPVKPSLKNPTRKMDTQKYWQ